VRSTARNKHRESMFLLLPIQLHGHCGSAAGDI
jgi:hypothetical protein